MSDFHYAPSPENDRGLDQAFQLVRRLDPDLIIVSGDLSREGLVEQLEPVVDFLATLGMDRVRAIPGNRDYPASRPGPIRPVDSDLHYFLTAPDTAEVANEAPGLSSAWTPFVEFFPDVDFMVRFPELTAVGLDSEPTIAPESLDAAMMYFEQSPKGIPRLFCTHRSLLPVPRKRVRDGDLLPNAGDVMQRLLAARVDVVLCAHLHRANAWRISDGVREMTVVNAPSVLDTSGSKENGVLTIDVSRGAAPDVMLYPLDGSAGRRLIESGRPKRRRGKGR